MKSILEKLIDQLEDKSLSNTSIIPWATPVIAFGDYEKAQVATLGLNPSNREFVDIGGAELLDFNRRFHTLSSLGLMNWNRINEVHLSQIEKSCRDYFYNNPYSGWFRDMEFLVSGIKKSFYSSNNRACHLDLIPYATALKWAQISSQEKTKLLEISRTTLAEILKGSPIRLLILNGKSVVDNFERISNTKFKCERKDEWNLPRKDKDPITGYSYESVVTSLCGISLNKEIKVLGFNHNLQSSFGVTRQVRVSIQQWIAKSNHSGLINES